jgi:flagellar biosynthetic protein FliO
MENPGARLIAWWHGAGPRARWAAGIALFSLFCTALLAGLAGSSPGALAADGTPMATPELSAWYMAEVLFKLALVLGLFVGGAALFRRYLAGGRLWQSAAPRARRLEIVETLRIGPRQSLHLVRAGERCLLIGATEQSFTLLSDLAEGSADLPAPAPAFEAVLASLATSAHEGA